MSSASSASSALAVLVMGPNDSSRRALETRIAGIDELAVLPHDGKHRHTADVVMVAADRDEFDTIRRIAASAALTRPPILLVVAEPFAELMSAMWLGARGIVLSSATDRELADCAALVARRCTVVPEQVLNEARLPYGRRLPDWTSPHHDPRAALDRLSRRELEVLKLVGSGRNNAEIAERLWLSRNTVRSHVQRLMRKLGLRNRLCLIIFAHELGLCAGSDAVHAPDHGL